jgi:hypothetical protein
MGMEMERGMGIVIIIWMGDGDEKTEGWTGHIQCW